MLPYNNNLLTIKVIKNKDEFYALKDQWQTLLNKSQSNKLFLSWQWQYSWWLTWGDKLDLKVLILLAYDESELVGIAPLYLDNVNYKGFFNLERIQFIGNSWDKCDTVRTEYLEFITSANMDETVCEAFIHYISELDDWDEFVLCDIPNTSTTFSSIKQLKKKFRWYLPKLNTDYGVKIITCGDFKSYISLLGRNTRLKLYNRRKHLLGLKDVKIDVASKFEIDKSFTTLNALHKQRWGKECFTVTALSFHITLIQCLNEHQSYELSCISIDSKPVSLLYNLTAHNTNYNIQAGYIENYDKKLSLGTMHLGYAIEKAFNDKTVRAFDMLIGSGKNEFYKNRYKGVIAEFQTLRVVRSNKLKLFLIVYYLVPDYIKKIISSLIYKLRCHSTKT